VLPLLYIILTVENYTYTLAIVLQATSVLATFLTIVNYIKINDKSK